MDNENLQIGEEVYYLKHDSYIYSFGDVKEICIGYCVITETTRKPLVDLVRIERISRNRLDILRLEVSEKDLKKDFLEIKKPMQMLLFN